MSTFVSKQVMKEWQESAVTLCRLQNEGVLEKYLEAAKALCKEKGIAVCDCYRKWKALHRGGVVTDNLLSNRLNHPKRDMNWLFAISLLETIFEM